MAPHGTPDFWGRGPKGITYALDDMAELAVRLGSFMNYDRRGEVFYANDFDNGGRGYVSLGGGTGNEVYLSADQVAHGSMCLVLKTGDGIDDYCTLIKTLRHPDDGPIGFEVSFVPHDNLAKIEFILYLYEGAKIYTYLITYNHALGTLILSDSAGADVAVGTCGVLGHDYDLYHQFKLVINTLTRHYIRVMLNDNTYDVSAESAQGSANAGNRRMLAFVNTICTAAGASEVRLDNIIITQNEPG